MLDTEMLDLLSRTGGGAYFGPSPPPPPPPLEDVFARIVADGWAPRSPAFGPELDHLEASTIRGDCISPLLQAGDTVYVDPRIPAQSGDVCSFQLSRRGAEAQNSDLPVGQSPWSAGAAWCKLFVKYHGFDMLLDRYGNVATATLLACEHPDDVPVLHPVRNVRRAGRLLFQPDMFASQIGLNAATVTIINASSTTSSGNTGFTGLQNTGVVVNGTGVAPRYDCTAIVTATIQARQTVGTVGQIKALVRFSDNGLGTGYISAAHEEPIPGSSFGVITLQWQFNHVAANANVGQASIWFDNTGPSTNSFDWQSATLQVEYIIR